MSEDNSPPLPSADENTSPPVGNENNAPGTEANFDDSAFNPFSGAISDPSPDEDAEYERKMKEMFGDIEDLPEETVDTLRAANVVLREQVKTMTEAIEQENASIAGLREKIVASQESLRTLENDFKKEKQATIAALGIELVDAVDGLKADLAAIPADLRAADAKLDKFTVGMEKTLGQLATVFNKYNIRKEASVEATATVETSGDVDTTPAETVSDAPAQETAPDSPPSADETMDALRAEQSVLMQQIVGLTEALQGLQQKTKTLHHNVKDAAKSVENAARNHRSELKYASEKFVKELLPSLDVMELGLNSVPSDARTAGSSLGKFASDVETALGKILLAFNKHGVRQINPINQPFNEEEQEAMSTQPKEGVAEDTVILVAQKGYAVQDRVVRMAKVITAA